MYAGSHSAQCQGTRHGQLPGWGESHPETLDTTRSGLGPSSRAPEVSAQPGGLGSPGPSLRPTPLHTGSHTATTPGDRAWPTAGLGRVPPGNAGTLPDRSGLKLSGPGGVSTARRTRITRAETPAYTMHTGSHTASTPGDRAWPTAGRGRVPPGYDVYYRTGLGSSSRTPEASTQLGWPRITKAELRDIACTPGVTRHNAGRPDMAYCRTESPAVKWSSRIRHAQPDRSGLGSGPRAGRHSPEYSDHQCRALGVAVHSGQATRFRPGPGHHSILQPICKPAGRVQSPHDSSS